MKKFGVIVCAVIMTACVSREKNVKGIITDATMNTMTIVSQQGDTLMFSVLSAERDTPEGILLQDTAIISYMGEYHAGMNAEKIKVFPAKQQDDLALGAGQSHTYEGLLPAASGPGIRYSLTVRSRQHSGDGTFSLTMTYIEAEDGKDQSFSYTGKRFTQRGIPGDNDATVWQLVTDDKKDIFNFLYDDEQTLTLLNDKFEKSSSGLNYTLKLVE